MRIELHTRYLVGGPNYDADLCDRFVSVRIAPWFEKWLKRNCSGKWSFFRRPYRSYLPLDVQQYFLKVNSPADVALIKFTFGLEPYNQIGVYR